MQYQRRRYGDAERETANDRMKRRSALWFPGSLVLAAIFHVALFSFAPAMTLTDGTRRHTPDMHVVALRAAPRLPERPPVPERRRVADVGRASDAVASRQVVIPGLPERIAEPALPFVTDLVIPEIALDVATFTVPPPTPSSGPGSADSESSTEFREFVPSMVAPRVLNRDEVTRYLQRKYPPMLRNAGIGGDVEMRLWLDEKGAVVNAEIARRSGHKAFDEVALDVVEIMKLSPAQSRGTPVRVIVTLPIRFQIR